MVEVTQADRDEAEAFRRWFMACPNEPDIPLDERFARHRISHQPQPSAEQATVDRIVAWLADDAARTADDLRKLHRDKRLTPAQTEGWDDLIAAKSGIAAAIQRGDWK